MKDPRRKLRGNRTRLAILAGSVALVSLFHFLVPTESHSTHIVHIVLRKLYFLPPVMAAVWFGLRGSAFTTAIISAAFILHAFLDWPGNYMEQANQLGELAGFWVVGLLPGWLFDRQRSLLGIVARAHEETLLVLVSALDMRERNTRLHSQRVREYTRIIGNRCDLSEEDRRVIALGALLHDVGKIAVPDRILLKAGGLSAEEWREMRRHPETGYRLLSRIGFLAPAAEIVYAHHEHYDGTGYPRGLAGEAIPLGARLFMVADVYDALTSPRPYHQPLAHAAAARAIRAKSGNHFDPAVVARFEEVSVAEWEDARRRFAESNGNGLVGGATPSAAETKE